MFGTPHLGGECPQPAYKTPVNRSAGPRVTFGATVPQQAAPNGNIFGSCGAGAPSSNSFGASSSSSFGAPNSNSFGASSSSSFGAPTSSSFGASSFGAPNSNSFGTSSSFGAPSSFGTAFSSAHLDLGQKMGGQMRSARKKSRGGSMTSKQKINVVTGKPLNESHTVIGMVVDRSGSMSSMRNEVHGGCNAYLDEQRKHDKEDKGTSSVIFTRFDCDVEVLLDGVNLHNVQPITAADVEPGGSTALYDAIGTTLVRTAEYVNKLDYMPSVVIFILTDGHENASQQWDKKSITEEIKRLQLDDFKWDFYFAAANQDGMAEGSTLGMAPAQCTTWNSASPSKVVSAFTSSSAAYYRKKKCGMMGYSMSERAEMMEEE